MISIHPRTRGILVAIGKVAITCALLAVIVAKIDFATVAAQWRLLDPLTLAFCLAVLFAEVSVIAGLRLKFVLEAIGTRRPLGKLLQVVLSGFFFEQIAFGFLGGDSMRFIQMRRFDISAGQALGAIVADRILGMASLVVFALFGLPGLLHLVSSLGRNVVEFAAAAMLVVSIAAAAVFFTRISEWFHRNVSAQLAYLRDRLRAHGGLRARVYAAIGLACLTHLMNVLVFALIGRALHLDLGLVDWLFVVPPVLLISIMPLSAGGWGLREASLIVLLGDLGVPAGQAVIPSLIFGFSLIVVTLPGGLLWLANRDRARSRTAPLAAAPQSLDAG